jgi:hypothetical protein
MRKVLSLVHWVIWVTPLFTVILSYLADNGVIGGG